MASPLLKVEDLTVRFPSADPVNRLSFELGEGETLAIVGESGSGKSLTALALMQLLPPSARIAGGRVQFAGRDLIGLDAPEMRKLRGRDIAMIFQEPMTSLNPVLSVGRQITEMLTLHEGIRGSAARRRAVELLSLVRIPDPQRRVDDYPHQLSGGMRQRVMIAIAVACRPRLLIADEPTTALDVTIQAQVLDLLDSLRRELSMALVLITHDVGIVAQWADKVIVMYAGRKVEQALPDALFSTPLHPYTRGLLAASPRLKSDLHYRESRLIEIPGSSVSATGERGCPFRPRCAIARDSCAHFSPNLIDVGDGRLVACPYTFGPEVAHDAAVRL
ncbi:ABC transporter ATP-binding protein [Mesorhizobium sp.]|uniref:ABC transporter ATP-binding protein n=2 Tax=unclassified Mesorhizobium TaxID=325217 RepID=UPI000FE65031|nr:ABC transporter ATP-binding protein [Mesorhizobium sp.]RWD91861.1 MAG: ABC transporter ATP-binding protein [Mesorhizobium sp.]RWD95782.1 MAG: ABC transporter ATP-binding protein [Mesorhizobium sp.]